LNATKTAQSELADLREKPYLEPNLWARNGILHPEVRLNLLRVAKDFFDGLGIAKETLADVQLTGSLASFAWSKHSDIDLHLIVDFSAVPADVDVAERYFDAIKNLWNEQHRVMIKGYEVEIYVENVSSQHVSNGLYSLVKGAWLEIPVRDAERGADDLDVIAKADKWSRMVEWEAYDPFVSGDHERVVRATKSLSARFKRWRQCGLDRMGLSSVENLAYKLLRRRGHIKALRDLSRISYDAIMGID